MGSSRRRCRTRKLLTVVVAVVVVLASVGGWVLTHRSPGAGGASTAGPSPVSGPTPQEFDNGTRCPLLSDPVLTQPAGCVSSVIGDLDGDTQPDRFVVYARLRDSGLPRSWEALAVLSGTGGPTQPIPVPTGQGVPYVYPRAMDAVDADGDGAAEVFVKLSAILYHVGGQQILGMFRAVAGRVVPIEVEGRGRLVFPIGGIGGYGDGAECIEGPGTPIPILTLRHIQRKPPSIWVWVERDYRWRGAVLVLQRTRRGTFPGTISIGDQPVHRFYQLRCGSLLGS
jgi:hypothetical protein